MSAAAACASRISSMRELQGSIRRAGGLQEGILTGKGENGSRRMPYNRSFVGGGDTYPCRVKGRKWTGRLIDGRDYDEVAVREKILKEMSDGCGG